MAHKGAQAAETLLRLMAMGGTVPAAVTDALLASVLDTELVRLALAARDAAPEHRARRLVELAIAVSRAAEAAASREARHA